MTRYKVRGSGTPGDPYRAPTEEADLQASEIACAVADAFLAQVKLSGRDSVPYDLLEPLERIEYATRSSALRKVKP